MNHFEKLILTLAIIFISLAGGYLFRLLAARGLAPVAEEMLGRLRMRLQTVAVFVLIPLSAMLSLWGLPQPDSELLILPMLGLASYIWGGILAIGMAKLIQLDRAQTGSFFCCGSFANIGAVGGLVCLMFLGENSIALVALYRLLEEVYYFGVSFPVAAGYAAIKQASGAKFARFRLNPIPVIILIALGTGIFLNFRQVPRADFLGDVAAAAMLAATVFFLFAIGLSLKIAKVADYLPPGLVMCGIKFTGVPLVIIFMADICGLASFDNGLALKTVAILSAMPVAMTALVPPSLLGLDLDLANACWIITTLGLAAILPALMLLLPVL